MRATLALNGLIQIGTAPIITNRGRIIINRGIGADLLHIGVDIENRCNYYKLVHKSLQFIHCTISAQ